MSDTPARQAPLSLLRVLGLVFGLAVVVGGVIGSGIMRAPGLVAQGLTTTPVILVAWALGGALAMLAAMPLVEAGSEVPLAGGPYPIAERAFGRTAGFFTGWMAWLQYAASSAFISSVFGEYVHRLGLMPQVSTHVLACGLILATAALNWIGTRVSGASQSIASALKGAFYVALIVILFASPRGPAAPAHVATAVTSVGAAIMAIRLIYQTYAGWDAAIYFSEEVHRPDRNVARATFAGIGLCTAVYVLVNAAALHVLPPAVMAGSELAVGDAAKVSMGALANTIITAFGLFSLAAIVNLQTMVATRITFRMARDGALPTLLGKVAPGGTPRRSLVLLLVVSLLFAATGGYESIVRIYAPWSIGVTLIICLAAIRLRYAEPDLIRPWRMPLFPWPAILAALIQAALIAVVVWDDPLSGLFSGAAVIAPVPIYLMLRSRWEASAGREFGAASR
ncbi:MAG TPA: APC family permease [Caulobacteraceae bacterium]|jgi:APA family basic amino acid/polyamine antiporter|nr:APC family permease [Caulobacteraceae bacterium]